MQLRCEYAGIQGYGAMENTLESELGRTNIKEREEKRKGRGEEDEDEEEDEEEDGGQPDLSQKSPARKKEPPCLNSSALKMSQEHVSHADTRDQLAEIDR